MKSSRTSSTLLFVLIAAGILVSGCSGGVSEMTPGDKAALRGSGRPADWAKTMAQQQADFNKNHPVKNFGPSADATPPPSTTNGK